jgi:hypothetical protein
MNKMIAITIRPGATTAAARLICPFACKIPPPAATSTSAKVPSNSENSRRHSRRGSSKSLRSPNSRVSMWCVRGNAAASSDRSICWAVAPLTPPVSCAAARVPGPPSRLTGTLSAMPQSFPSTAPKNPHHEDRMPKPGLVFGEALAGHRYPAQPLPESRDLTRIPPLAVWHYCTS